MHLGVLCVVYEEFADKRHPKCLQFGCLKNSKATCNAVLNLLFVFFSDCQWIANDCKILKLKN